VIVVVWFLPRLVGFGEPWISGNVNLLQGKVDLKFRIEGSKGESSPTSIPKHVPRLIEIVVCGFVQRKRRSTLRRSDRQRMPSSRSVRPKAQPDRLSNQTQIYIPRLAVRYKVIADDGKVVQLA
jgi:hypothetical protein